MEKFQGALTAKEWAALLVRTCVEPKASTFFMRINAMSRNGKSFMAQHFPFINQAELFIMNFTLHQPWKAYFLRTR